MREVVREEVTVDPSFFGELRVTGRSWAVHRLKSLSYSVPDGLAPRSRNLEKSITRETPFRASGYVRAQRPHLAPEANRSNHRIDEPQGPLTPWSVRTFVKIQGPLTSQNWRPSP